jgi:hypothetical protein
MPQLTLRLVRMLPIPMMLGMPQLGHGKFTRIQEMACLLSLNSSVLEMSLRSEIDCITLIDILL